MYVKINENWRNQFRWEYVKTNENWRNMCSDGSMVRSMKIRAAFSLRNTYIESEFHAWGL